MRLLPSYSALWGFAALYDFGVKPFIVYAPPLQKVFYAPIVLLVWGVLALIPFILLRSSIVFRIYCTLFFACLAFMAYDYLVPFRYVSPDFRGEILDSGGGFSSSGNHDSVAYWVSYPTFPLHEDDWPVSLVRVAPLILAFGYRRYYPLWAANAS
ncbi:MAG: hypothetical protein HZA92_03140 [Verrucomicrobia bacterium]|nr:hypothetical protein [Verrucomicrobiota bacterium]